MNEKAILNVLGKCVEPVGKAGLFLFSLYETKLKHPKSAGWLLGSPKVLSFWLSPRTPDDISFLSQTPRARYLDLRKHMRNPQMTMIQLKPSVWISKH